jgi:hypothetical protein
MGQLQRLGHVPLEAHATKARTGPPVGTLTITAKGPINLSTGE